MVLRAGIAIIDLIVLIEALLEEYRTGVQFPFSFFSSFLFSFLVVNNNLRRRAKHQPPLVFLK